MGERANEAVWSDEFRQELNCQCSHGGGRRSPRRKVVCSAFRFMLATSLVRDTVHYGHDGVIFLRVSIMVVMFELIWMRLNGTFHLVSQRFSDEGIHLHFWTY